MMKKILRSCFNTIQCIYLNKSIKYSNITSTKQSIKYKYRFQTAIGFKPHPNKIAYGGDDYSFASDNIIVVADGVGSWIQGQVEPSLYARKIVRFIEKIYKNQKKITIQKPIYGVQQAVKMVKLMGSTTLTLLTLNPQTGKLKTYYIGDSVYGFFRKQQVEMCQLQMVSFNKPYQIGYGAHKLTDAYQNQYQSSQIGQDLIVVGSDGLWDNLTLDRIHYQSRGPNSLYKNGLNKSLTQIAQRLADLGYKYSLSSNYQSPYYKRAIQQGAKYPKQGKVDDITVILAKIIKQQMKKDQKYF